MTAEESLYTVLTNFAGLTALISTRTYPLLLPQDPTLPGMTYTRVTGSRQTTLVDGTGGDLERVYYQLDAWATTIKAAYQVSAQARLALAAATTFKTVYLQDRDGYDTDTKLFRVSTDYAIWHP